ncbi:MAG: hypothetical protein K0S74_870 [Chlamydiales bacterium]|jgi:hypothetical protein|nr:hypothetical protein [Chlamydiales bacterium]
MINNAIFDCRFEDVVETVKGFSNNNKTGLFIGRNPTEILPKEPDTQWFSLDIDSSYSNNSTHFQVDFNDLDTVKKMARLFDKVVVDQSVWKGFQTTEDSNPLDRIALLLKNKSDSIAIFSVDSNLLNVNFGISEVEFDYTMLSIPGSWVFAMNEKRLEFVEKYLEAKNEEEKKLDYAVFLASDYCQEKMARLRKFEEDATVLDVEEQTLYKKWIIATHSNLDKEEKDFEKNAWVFAIKKTENYAKQIFTQVELKEKQPFPYEVKYNQNSTTFFVCKGPKV